MSIVIRQFGTNDTRNVCDLTDNRPKVRLDQFVCRVPNEPQRFLALKLKER